MTWATQMVDCEDMASTLNDLEATGSTIRFVTQCSEAEKFVVVYTTP